VQVWEGKVFVGTLDGYLACLDAATGKEIWKQDTFIDRTAFYTITGPPQIAKDKVVIGNSGAEFGVRGYISAYDIETGKLAWRFFTVPGDPSKEPEHEEMTHAAKTWDAKSDWKSGGGGTVWGELAYDPMLNLLYVGTGNSSPYPSWYRSPAGGDNLFLVSILAINPDNGKLAWYYQTTPGESWDYTCTMNIVLADLTIKNKVRKVLMQAPKNGFFYVIDRATGELISAEKFVPVNWASKIDLKTGRPVLTEHGWYKDTLRYIFPGPAGGHNWQPMSYSPQTGLVYIPTLDWPFIYEPEPDYKFKPGQVNTGVNMWPAGENERKEWPEPEREVLKAWDPVTQKEVWRVSHEDQFNGGILSTSGNLVFQGTTAGQLIVYRADTGEKLKTIETGTGIMAAPATYTVEGEQYIAVMAGFGGALVGGPGEKTAVKKYRNTGRILAFKLGGGTTPLPAPQFRNTVVPEPPHMKPDKTMISNGKALYNNTCANCHNGFGKGHLSEFPDLSMLTKPVHDAFNEIVLEGTLSFYGMASFSDVLTEKNAGEIHQYLVSVQRERFVNSQLSENR
jgi:quinohemoprotein ethanol dehydrogenase